MLALGWGFPTAIEAQWGADLELQPWVFRGVGNSAFSPTPAPGGNPLERPGRGASVSVAAGGRVRWGPLVFQATPTVVMRRRLDETPLRELTDGGGAASSVYGGIDWPSAWAPGTEMELHFADTRLALVAPFGFEIAASNERLAWGPSARHGLIFSGHAQGFPHVSIQRAPGAERVFEMEWVVGEVSESPYFDTRADNDRRQLVGVALAFSPPFAPGLTVGFGGVQHRELANAESARSGWQALFELPGSLFASDLSKNLPGNGLGSVFARWAPPGSGFSVYGEFARDDHAEGFEDLLQEPDHAQAWLAGVERTWVGDLGLGLGPRALSLLVETADTRSPAGTLSRRAGGLGVQFYTHSPVVQGHTHRGQLLGAPLGPGARSAYVQVRVDPLPEHAPSSAPPPISFWAALEQTEFAADVHRVFHAPMFHRAGRDLSWTLWLGGDVPAVRAGPLRGTVRGTLGLTRRENRDFHGFRGPDVRPAEGVVVPVEHNLHLTFQFVSRTGLLAWPQANPSEPRRLGAR